MEELAKIVTYHGARKMNFEDVPFKFIQGIPAAYFKEYLVIADIHIGIEREMREEGYNIPNQTQEMIDEIVNLRRKAKKLLILGDVKHSVPYSSFADLREIPFFVNELANNFEEIIIIKGNHDGEIEKLIEGIENVKVVKEIAIGNVGFVHGHAWPSKELMEKCNLLAIGHVHPVFKIKDELGGFYYKRCWIFGELNANEKYGKVKCKNVIVFPAFNKLLSGVSEIDRGPLVRILKRREIVLLTLNVI